MRKCDIAYMVENGEMHVSTRLEGARLERGMLEVEDMRKSRIPYDREWFSGIVDLRRCDAFRVFRDGQAEIVHFEADDDEYAAVIEPTPSIVVLREHLVVRKCERDRVEALHADAGHTVAEGIGFPELDRLPKRPARCDRDDLGRRPGAGRPTAARGRAVRQSLVRRQVPLGRSRRELPADVGRAQVTEAVAASHQVGRPRAVPAATETGVNRRGFGRAFPPIPHRSNSAACNPLIS